MDRQQDKTVVRNLSEVIKLGELDPLSDLVATDVVDHNAVIDAEVRLSNASPFDPTFARADSMSWLRRSGGVRLRRVRSRGAVPRPGPCRAEVTAARHGVAHRPRPRS